MHRESFWLFAGVICVALGVKNVNLIIGFIEIVVGGAFLAIYSDQIIKRQKD